MERFTKRLKDGGTRLNIADYGEPPYPVVTNDFVRRLAKYEDTGLTPEEIEQMKARMPLHQWAGESPDKMSIFSVPVSKIVELVKAEKEGRLIALASDKDQLRILKDRCKICPYWNGKSCDKTQCLVCIKIKN